MKKSLHIINILLLICEGATGAVILFNAGQSDFMPYISGAAAVIMSIAMLITGALLPKKETMLSKGQQKAAKAVMVSNTVLNGELPNSADFDVVTGKKGLRRSWEPFAIAIWLLLQSLTAVFVIISASGILRVSEIVSVVILLLLIFTSAAWKAADNKEKYGRPMLKAVFLPIAVLVLVIAVVGGISYIKESRRWKESEIPVPVQNDGEQENVQTEEDGDTKEELLDKVSADFPGETLRYRMMEGRDGGYSLVVWNDTEDTVYLYLLKKDNQEHYIIESKMISDSLTKADVEGKEEGVFGKKAEKTVD